MILPKKTTYLLLSLLPLWLGCGQTLYVPNNLFTPLLAEKKDYAFNLAMRPIAPSNIEFQGSYAPLDHLAVMLNGAHLKNDENNDLADAMSHSFAETGLGVFTVLGNPKDKLFRAEIFGGYGLGASQYGIGNFERFDGSYQRKFLQPALGVRSENASIFVAARLAETNFSHYHAYQDGQLVETGTYNFTTLEPMLGLNVGFPGFKFGGNLSWVTPKGGKSDLEKAVQSRWPLVALMGTITISKNKNKKKRVKPTIALAAVDSSTIGTPKEDLRFDLGQPHILVCVKQVGKSDHDLVALKLNAVVVSDNISLDKTYHCFKLEALPGQDNLLQIEGIGGGKHPGINLKVLLRDGQRVREFYLNMKQGDTESVHLKL